MIDFIATFTSLPQSEEAYQHSGTTTKLEESLSCGLSQWIRGLRWIPCTCDVVGSNLAPALSHPRFLSLCHLSYHCSAYSLMKQKQIPQLYVCSRQSCEDEMFPPTQAGRQAVALETQTPPTVMLWNIWWTLTDSKREACSLSC